MYKTFGTETLLSEDLNGIMRQTIIRVADAAELDALAPVEAGMMAYREDNAVTYRRSSDGWVDTLDNIPWTPVAVTSSWTVTNAVEVCRRNGIIYWRGRVTPVSNRSGTQTIIAAGEVPPWARPTSVYDTLKPLAAAHSSATAAAAVKNAGVTPDGAVTAWYGDSNTSALIFAGLSGYVGQSES